MSDSPAPDCEERVDEAVARFLGAEESGTPLNTSAWLEEYAEVAGELRAFLRDHRRVRRKLAPRPDLGPYTAGAELLDAGGMGAVYVVRDPVLNRPLALKVMHPHLAANPGMARRFREEAQVAGQLQHPNIAPVHELGTLPDGRPYFTMRLVEGKTLAAALAASHAAPTAAGADELLRQFVAVCEAVAFAHARGVLHRDLKPANVMLGRFGEVQVMDWGLSKSGGPVDEEAGPAVATTAAEAGQSQDGVVRGTFAYMPPEQAAGQPLTPAADIWALGAILCEILTGSPPYATGETERSKRQADLWGQARTGATGPALARLAERDVPPELRALAGRCLAAEPADRPDGAKAVADAVRAYQAGAAERARRAELDRAAAEARADAEAKRAAAERRRRRAQLGAVVAAALLVASGTAGGAWYKFDRDARALEQAAQEADRAARQVEAEYRVSLATQGAALLRDGGRLEDALAAARQAGALAQSDRVGEAARTEAQRLVAALEAEAAEAARDRRLLTRVFDALLPEEAVARQAGFFVSRIRLDEQFAAAFREYGIDLDRMTDEAILARVGSRPEAVRAELAAALDVWTIEGGRGAGPAAPRHRLARLARAADRDQDRNDIRSVLERLQVSFPLNRLLAPLARTIPDSDHNLLRDRAGAADPQTSPALTVRLLAVGLLILRENEQATDLLRRAVQAHPDDIGLCWLLSYGLLLQGRERWPEAVGYLQAIRARRPELGCVLAGLLTRIGRSQEAAGVCRDLVRRQPDSALAHAVLGMALASQNQMGEAESACRKAVALQPDLAEAHAILGQVLLGRNKKSEAEAACREAVRLQPGLATAHGNLGVVLAEQHKWAEAESACRVAALLDPQLPETHVNLGPVLADRGKLVEAEAECREAIRLQPDLALAHNNLGYVLYRRRQFPKAEAACREALRLDPGLALAHSNLGVALAEVGSLAEGEAACREAVRLQPGLAMAHNNLGAALAKRHQLPQAEAACREAIRLDPELALAHSNLGAVLAEERKWAEAEAECREALRLEPGLAIAHNNLGMTLIGLKKPAEAEAECREAIRLEPGLAIAHANLGHALFDQKRIPDADRALREAIRLDPGLALAHGNLGALLSKQGKLDEAEAECREGVRLGPGSGEGYRCLGEVLLRRKKLAEAVAACHRAVELNRDDGDAYFFLYQALEESGRGGESLDALRQAVRLSPGDARLQYILGSNLRDAGQKEEAVAAFRRAVQLRPGHAATHRALGILLAEQGKLDEAVAVLRTAVRLQPENPLASLRLAGTLEKQGKVGEAIEALREFTDKPGRDNPLALNRLGRLLEKAGRPEEAKNVFLRAVAFEAKDADGFVDRGLAYASLGDLPKAIAAYRQAVSLDPKLPEGFNNLGLALLELGEFDEAAACLRKAIELDPTLPNPHNHLGDTLLQQGRLDAAVTEYKRAAELGPNYAAAQVNLGEALKRQGRLAEALAAWERALKLLSPGDGERDRVGRSVQVVKQMKELDARLAGLLSGTERPEGADRNRLVADLCFVRKHYPAAVRFYAAALAQEPQPTRPDETRFRAARAAVLAAFSEVKNRGRDQDSEQVRHRRLALDWLRAELALTAAEVSGKDTPPEKRYSARKYLRSWQAIPDLSPVRDTAELRGAERSDWQRLWADVDALLAEVKPPPPGKNP